MNIARYLLQKNYQHPLIELIQKSYGRDKDSLCRSRSADKIRDRSRYPFIKEALRSLR